MRKIRIKAVRRLGDAIAIGLEWIFAPFHWLAEEATKLLEWLI